MEENEMTKEDAIKVLQDVRDRTRNFRIIEAICTLHPELAESEDERIRKEIIEFIQWSEDRGMTRHDFHQRKRPGVWLAWLEKQKEPHIPWYDLQKSKEAGYTILKTEEYEELIKQKEQKPVMIQWTGENLKEVIDFTGKSPKFDEYFKSWEDFEKYVHSHDDIFKLFCEDGSHYEVPIGAWIVKTPDGYNIPSRFKFVQKPAEWDEYTKTNLDRALQIIKKAKGTLQGYQSDDGIYECDKAIECLEHFLYRGLEIEKSAEIAPNQFDGITYRMQGHSTDKPEERFEEAREKYQVEWSEEDEKNIGSIAARLDSILDCSNATEAIKITKEIAWLKSLRPHLSDEEIKKIRSEEYTKGFNDAAFGGKAWRPSEEDIKMLEHIIGQYETGNKNSKVMGYLPKVEELSFLKKVLLKWKN